MLLSPWQITLKTDVVLTNKSPIVAHCAEAQEYLEQKGIHGFTQRYIPIELNLEATLITTAPKGSTADMHQHRGGSLRYIISGKYRITYRENGKEEVINLDSDDWIYIPINTAYKTEVIEDVKIMHLYCVTNCG